MYIVTGTSTCKNIIVIQIGASDHDTVVTAIVGVKKHVSYVHSILAQIHKFNMLACTRKIKLQLQLHQFLNFNFAICI